MAIYPNLIIVKGSSSSKFFSLGLIWILILDKSLFKLF